VGLRGACHGHGSGGSSCCLVVEGNKRGFGVVCMRQLCELIWFCHIGCNIGGAVFEHCCICH